MSGEESTNYDYAQSNGSTSANATPSNDSSHEFDFSEPRPIEKAVSSSFLRSESLFLALLFALVALLMPTFFSFASPPSSSPSSDSTETRESPLAALLPYIPTIHTLLRLSYSTLRLLLLPFVAVLSVVLAILAPLFLALNILFKLFVLVPARIVAELVQFFYPVYLFLGVACLFGAGIGFGGRLLIEGSKLMLPSTPEDNVTRKTAKRLT